MFVQQGLTFDIGQALVLKSSPPGLDVRHNKNAPFTRIVAGSDRVKTHKWRQRDRISLAAWRWRSCLA